MGCKMGKPVQGTVGSAKCVSIAAMHVLQHLLVSVDIKGTLLAVCPQVVQTIEMVCMAMGIEHPLQVHDASPQRLHSEFGTGVHHQVLPPLLQENRGTHAIVLRVGRPADSAGAPRNGDAVAGAGSKEGQPHFALSSMVRIFWLKAMPPRLAAFLISSANSGLASSFFACWISLVV